jgi:hypothetical protein
MAEIGALSSAYRTLLADASLLEKEPPSANSPVKEPALKTMETDFERLFAPLKELTAVEGPKPPDKPVVAEAAAPGNEGQAVQALSPIVIQGDDVSIEASTTYVTTSYSQSTSKTFKDSVYKGSEKSEKPPESPSQTNQTKTDVAVQPASEGKTGGASRLISLLGSAAPSSGEESGSGADALRRDAAFRLSHYALLQGDAAPAGATAPPRQTEGPGLDTVV